MALIPHRYMQYSSSSYIIHILKPGWPVDRQGMSDHEYGKVLL